MADLNKILTGLKVSRKNEFLPFLEKELKKFSDEDVARFLANVLHETGLFSVMRENMYYSTAERLKVIYPTLFVKMGYNPFNYIKNPQKLANLVYDSRINPNVKFLGNDKDGDGFKYRGGGLMQTTGKNNYIKLSQISKIDFVENTELIEQPEFAVKSAVIFYTSNKLDKKSTLKEVRIAVRGSYSSADYNEVLKLYNKIKSFM